MAITIYYACAKFDKIHTSTFVKPAPLLFVFGLWFPENRLLEGLLLIGGLPVIIIREKIKTCLKIVKQEGLGRRRH